MNSAVGAPPRPLVSVIVPFFKSEDTVAACAEGLLTQQLDGPYEILFVNNRSPDGSAVILEGYDGLTVLQEDEPGAYAARNTGLRHARAPIIAFTDADCVPDADWLQNILDCMADPQIGALMGHCRYPDSSSWPLRLLARYENAKTEYVLGHPDPGHRFGYCNNMAVRAAVFQDLGPFLTWQRAADSELIHRLTVGWPDSKILFHPAMRINHLEFRQGKQRAERLRLYSQTNAQILTFKELSVGQRIGILLRAMLRSPA